MDLHDKKRRMVAVSLLSAALLGIPAGAAVDTEQESLVKEAKLIIKAELKDPGSAQFQNVAIVMNSQGETAVCGEYNARNSYGGYVGFKQFGVANRISSTNTEELERMGCNGTEAETSRREKDAHAALIDRFRTEADFNCNVIWTFLQNHFRNGEPIDAVLGAAMTATVNRARENGGNIAPSVLQMIREEYKSALIKTSNDKAQVKSIRRGDHNFKHQFITGCTMQTVQAMEAQAKSGI